jgi:hypothetical protein
VWPSSGARNAKSLECARCHSETDNHLTSDGALLTNNHVVTGASYLSAPTSSGALFLFAGSGQRESNPHFVSLVGSRSALGEEKAAIYNQKLRHTCVKICVTFPRFLSSL